MAGHHGLELRFVASAARLEDCPRWDRVEAAFAGRSNAGKSSLLNAVGGGTALARVGRAPGQTRTLNFFVTGGALALVDLPGYGYARVSAVAAQGIAALLRCYLERRGNLGLLTVVMDARRPLAQEERLLIELAARRGIELVLAATKFDRLSTAERAQAERRFSAAGLRPVFCSVKTGIGVEEIRRRILSAAPARRPPALCSRA